MVSVELVSGQFLNQGHRTPEALVSTTTLHPEISLQPADGSWGRRLDLVPDLTLPARSSSALQLDDLWKIIPTSCSSGKKKKKQQPINNDST